MYANCHVQASDDRFGHGQRFGDRPLVRQRKANNGSEGKQKRIVHIPGTMGAAVSRVVVERR